MKVIAMYLPQYHRVKENDEWWGEGFTDWIAAKNAKPLFEGHYQPHIPLNNNYYDLLEKETMQWQAELMKEYRVDGLCFFHYWFKGGRRILEKPAENLLEWSDIDMPFCFCWANESWARTWDAIPGANVWTIHNMEDKKKDIKQSFLLEQDYGSANDWTKHFMYLLPFFKDNRYIKIEGKPVFQLYRAGQIYCLDEMLVLWQNLAKQNGLPGIYVMAANINGKLVAGVDAEFLYEPSKSFGNVKVRPENGIAMYSYDDIWQYIIQSRGTYKKQYFCGVVSFDTTPRKKEYGTCVSGATPEKFGAYMMALMRKSEEDKSDILFVTAWNEWGEGNHLEPDERYGYQWLEQLRNAKKNYKKYNHIVTLETHRNSLDNHERIRTYNKFEIYLNFLDRWMMLRERGICITSALRKRNIKTVLIYGYGIIGRHLLYELDDSGISIMGVIDQKNIFVSGIDSYTPDEKLPKADAIVVAAFYFYEEIRNVLNRNNVTIPIISFEEILEEAFFSI